VQSHRMRPYLCNSPPSRPVDAAPEMIERTAASSWREVVVPSPFSEDHWHLPSPLGDSDRTPFGIPIKLLPKGRFNAAPLGNLLFLCFPLFSFGLPPFLEGRLFFCFPSVTFYRILEVSFPGISPLFFTSAGHFQRITSCVLIALAISLSVPHNFPWGVSQVPPPSPQKPPIAGQYWIDASSCVFFPSQNPFYPLLARSGHFLLLTQTGEVFPVFHSSGRRRSGRA